MTDLELARDVWENLKIKARDVIGGRAATAAINGANRCLTSGNPHAMTNNPAGIHKVYQAIGRLEVEIQRVVRRRQR